jgi:2-(1,2-epoxy-1,2-dihydrophenyl)acetyl-CoA isomerase
MAKNLKLKIIDRTAQIILARPESFNALDLPTARELSETLLGIALDNAIHGVVLTGTGAAFSAGGDIKGAVNHSHGPSQAFHELATHVHLCITEIRRMKKPVIAAINGVAAGGGFSLALACDFRIMAASARLKQGFTSNALCIDAGGTFILPRLVGLARALEIATFDEPIDANQALAWGLVTKITEDDDVLAESMEMARVVASKSLHTFGWSKALLTNSFETSLEAQLEKERQGLVNCVAHPDGEEGMHAFLEKRKPIFGRQ